MSKNEENQWVVICFQISIFEPLETTAETKGSTTDALWFAFKLVSLNHWKQLWIIHQENVSVVICFQISIFEPLETTHWCVTEKGHKVVICFQISIFEPLETTRRYRSNRKRRLWFAFKLVSLNHWKQLE